MNPYYSAISERANHRCEYCHAPELVFNFPFEVEHIQIDTETGMAMGITAVGKVTVENLKMNSAAQVAARKLWIRLGLFP